MPDGAGLEHEIGLLLFRVKTGQPKSEGLMKLLENPENLRLMNQAELDLHKDQKKVDLYREKEELLFAIDEKSHEADLTEKGRNFISPKDPEAFVLPDLTTLLHEIDAGPETDARKRMEAKTKLQQDFETKAQKIHAISQLLKAYSLYQMDVEYVVQENKVIIVDQHTGRLMPGRRWSDGLHQAVEAKEGVEIERETQTLATITIQNYFRLYQKLAGMTGTAETEATEFLDIYKLGVLTIPTNQPNIRKDTHDSVYKTRREKFNAVVEEIKELHAQGRPDSGRHRFRRNQRNAVADAEARRVDSFRSQREISPAGGRNRLARRPARRHHDRHEHGRPRHGHQTRPRRRRSRRPARARHRTPRVAAH